MPPKKAPAKKSTSDNAEAAAKRETKGGGTAVKVRHILCEKQVGTCSSSNQ
ncbi:hypothetical protein KIN20_032879 [Parelaphostrongylus tenuis]|uniref:Uncharacterized protein n=1 Tax=Parelaphostrongylus tenuis TaxID=148309 RepID=A0AAD5WIT6_PARTN|nr:hypothetical protein KIN20_032879 [Parelaphostrongylus tenuis]